jgi:UDP-2-acetamido-2-deoxy-ribo-hexuluronate aminotransferase
MDPTPRAGAVESPGPGAGVAFNDLRQLYLSHRDAIDVAAQAVLASGQWVLGENVQRLEALLAEHVGVAHCISCGSGTQALAMALMALGIGPGDEVITVPFTWISTVQSVVSVGAQPVLVDIEADGFTIDPARVAAAIGPRTRAIMPVSLFGQAYDVEAIAAIAADHGLPVIEDAAQSFGASRNGRQSCGLSTIGCTSFYPTKPLACFGDGGAIFTADDALAQRLRAIRVHGAGSDGLHHHHGVNGRFDPLQAAMMLASWDGFAGRTSARQQVAADYAQRLGHRLNPPPILPGNTHVYAQYTLRVPQRDALQAALEAKGIPTRAYYQRCVHQQPGYQHLTPADGLPVAEAAATQALSLPMHPWLEADQVAVVADSVLETLDEVGA